MAEPATDHVDVNARLEQMYGGRVAKDMRANVAPDRRGALNPQGVGMAPDDLVEAEAREGTRPMGCEERPRRRRRRARLS